MEGYAYSVLNEWGLGSSDRDNGVLLLLAPGEEGIHQVALTNAAYLSAWTDDWVSLPVDAAAYEKQLRARIAGSAKKASPTAGEIPSGQYSPRWNIRW